MLFNSIAFAKFLIVAFALYHSFAYLSKRFFHRTDLKWIPLSIVSAYFYACSGFYYLLLMLFAIVVTYFCGIGMEKASPGKRKWILVATLTTCLGILFTFKYLGFFLTNTNSLLSLLGLSTQLPVTHLILPVGISFYTFQTLSYVVDVYRGTTTAEHNFGKYFAFVTFFPQLVAGPIERSDNLLPQIKAEAIFRYDKAVSGMRWMLIGFFKKLIIADNLSQYVDMIYASPQEQTGYPLLMATIFFTFQIYCDFSGYSDIAIGVAKLFGIDLMRNFKSPYLSVSLKEFWSRWHISLSTWFKDYVYIPLGGNRISAFRTSFNLLLTFIVSGFWHGASWNFLIWGALHGFFQIVEKHLPKNLTKKIPRLIKWIFVFTFVSVAWVFFRAKTFSDAIYIITHMFALSNIGEGLLPSMGLSNTRLLIYLLFILLLMAYDALDKSGKGLPILEKLPQFLRWGLYATVVFIILWLMPISYSTGFIYFQF